MPASANDRRRVGIAWNRSWLAYHVRRYTPLNLPIAGSEIP